MFTLFVNELAKSDMWPVIRVLCFLHHGYRGITLETFNTFVFDIFYVHLRNEKTICSMHCDVVYFKMHIVQADRTSWIRHSCKRTFYKWNKSSRLKRCSGVHSLSMSQIMAWECDYISWSSSYCHDRTPLQIGQGRETIFHSYLWFELLIHAIEGLWLS